MGWLGSLEEEVARFLLIYPGYRVPDPTEFESLAYLRESQGDPTLNPYVTAGLFNDDAVEDRAVVLVGPPSEDQMGWGWPVYDVAIVLFHGDAGGGFTRGYVLDEHLPAAALLLHPLGDRRGLAYGVYETDMVMHLYPDPNGHLGYRIEDMSPE